MNKKIASTENELPPVLQKRNKKMILLKIAFVLINAATVGFLFWRELKKNDLTDLGRALSMAFSNNILFVLASIGLAVLMVVFDGIGYIFIAKRGGSKCGFCVGLGTAVVGKYGDGITPLGTGGQPFQMYYLGKNGLPFELACAMPLVKYIIRIFTVDVIMVVFMLLGRAEINRTVFIMAIVGLLLNTFAPTGLLILSTNKKICNKLLSFAVVLGSKLHFVKDKETALAKWKEPVDNFSAAMKYLSGNFGLLVKLILLAALEFFAYLALPYTVCLALGQRPDFIVIATLAIYVQNAASFIPTPGASGVTDIAFYTVFAGALRADLVFPALLMWRFLSFYIYILAGLVVIAAMTSKKSKTKIRSIEERTENET